MTRVWKVGDFRKTDFQAVAWSLCACGLLLGLLAGCAQDQREAVYEKRVGATGRIREIDHEARRMVVQIGFQRLTLVVSDEIRSFDQRHVGERLHVDYLAAVVVALASEDGQQDVDVSRFHLSAARNGRPGVARVRQRQFSAKFIDYDHRSGLTTFQLDDGSYVVLLIPTRMQPFVRSLAPGVRVRASVEKAIAVSVDPVQ
ncbi:MAG: hypothetical protein ACI8R4_000790 [Paracoccaceae bacterium]